MKRFLILLILLMPFTGTLVAQGCMPTLRLAEAATTLVWDPPCGLPMFDVYRVYRRVHPATGWDLIGQTPDRLRTYTDTTAPTSGTGEYYVVPFRLSTIRETHAGSNVLKVTFTGDAQSPTVPTNLQVGAVTPTTVALLWTASTDNIGVTRYRVYRDGALVMMTPTVGYTVTGLTPNTMYQFTVQAEDAAGNLSAQTAPVSVTTPPDMTAPTVPANLMPSAITQTGFTLSWDPATDNVAVTGYRVFQNGTLIATVSAPPVAVGGLAAGTGYSFTVAAFDAAGNVSAQSAPLMVTTQAPSNLAWLTGAVQPGKTGQVTWSNVPTPHVQDWVAMYVVGADSTAYLEWFYTSTCFKFSTTPPLAQGTCSMTLPATLVVGSQVEFRLLLANGYTVLYTSQPYTVAP